MHPELELQLRSCFQSGDPVSSKLQKLFCLVDQTYSRLEGERLRSERAAEARYRTLFEESRRELLQAQKIEAMGQLAGGVAHDFNNLLTAIVGCTDLLAASEPPDAEQRALIAEIRAAAQRGNDLTRRLLAFGRRQEEAEQRLDLNALVANVRTLLERLIGDAIEIETRLEARTPFVTGDVTQLEQVVVNLAINARDAMPGGGRLLFSTRDFVAKGGNRRGIRPGSYVMMVVEDNGVGIDEEIQKLIFEPFFTTKTDDGGTGLGLALVHGIVQQAGAQINVASAPGKGTRFEILWPLAIGELSPPGAPEQRTGSSLNGAGQLILVVDDDEGVRSLTSRVLRRQGYAALEASCGSEAISLFSKHRDEVKALVSDVVMPGMQGPELAGELRRLAPDLRVLLMSGYTESHESWQHEPPEVALTFIQKPFTPVELTERLGELLATA